eukprot:1341813-Amorphochlora_amoeboformis.AAC.1
MPPMNAEKNILPETLREGVFHSQYQGLRWDEEEKRGYPLGLVRGGGEGGNQSGGVLALEPRNK